MAKKVITTNAKSTQGERFAISAVECPRARWTLLASAPAYFSGALHTPTQGRRRRTVRASAATNTVQIKFLESVPIVPSIMITWATVPETTAIADEVCARRQTCGRNRSFPRNPAKKAEMTSAHIATTPKTENAVGARKVIASIMSGGLVIQSPETCTATASNNATPIQRCIRRSDDIDNPGRYPEASKG